MVKLPHQSAEVRAFAEERFRTSFDQRSSRGGRGAISGRLRLAIRACAPESWIENATSAPLRAASLEAASAASDAAV